MASSIPPILVQLVADVTQLKAGMAQAEASLKGLDGTVAATSNKMSSFVGNLKRVGAAMGATFAASQIVSFGKESIMAASNINEALSKVGVVFGDNAKEIEKWAAGATDNFGMSERGALTAVGTFGNLFDAFGLGEEDTKKFSKSLTELAVDMASFNDMSVDDAMNALRSGLSGETEPMKKFGSVLSETRLKTEALTLGLIKNTKEALDPAAKAQAAYSLIMKDTARQQGDYDRTAGGTANTMRRVAAEMDNAKVAIGQGLLPVFNALLKVMEFGIVPVLKAVGKFLKENSTAVAVFGAVLAAGAAVWGVYTLAINAATIATKVWTAVTKANPIGLIITAVALLAAGIATLWKRSETFRNVIISVAKVAIKAFASIVPMVGQVFEAIAKVVLGPLKALLTVLSKLPGVGKYAKAGLDFMNKGLDGISDFSDKAAKKATGLIASLDKVAKQAGTTAEKVKAATDGVKDKGDGKGKGGGVSTKDLETIKKAQIAFDEDMLKARERYAEQIADAEKDYAKAQVEIRKDNAKELIDIAKDYAAKVKDIEANLQEKLTSLRADADKKRADLTKQAADKQISIIQQSIDRLRSAFATGAAFSISDLFKGKTSGGFLESMKKQLADAKALQEGAAFLSGQGYAQTFIEEVVKAGPTAGLEMINELKKATPEQQKVIQDTFMDLEAIQNTGLDSLARSMNNGANLATSELRQAYDQVAIDLKNSLAEVDAELKTSMAEANADYLKAMTEAAAVRDERIAESMAKMEEALAAAKLKYDEALADASATLQKSLNEAMKAFEKSIDATSVSTTQKINLLKTQLAEVTALMAAIAGASAGGGVGGVTPIKPITPLKPGDKGFIGPVSTTNNNINIKTTNLTDPKKVATDVVNGIKYGAAVTVPNRTMSQTAALRDR
jgi:phage-related protein